MKIDKKCVRMMLTNARSLMPKVRSLKDAFQSLELHFAAITETWFRGGRELKAKLEEIEDMEGIRIIHKSRDGRCKKYGGGVAIAFDPVKCNLKTRNLRSATRDQEIICAVGRAADVPRPIAVFALYVPPGTKASSFSELCDTLTTEIAAVKTACPGAAIFVGGDMNHRDITAALSAVDDFRVVRTGATRGANALDQLFTNIADAVVENIVLPPLENEAGVRSDHKCVFVSAAIKKPKDYRWIVRMRRTRNQERELAFARDLGACDWERMSSAPDVSAMAAILEEKIAELTERHFPLQRVRKRSNEDPWITRSIRRLWKKKIRLYRKNGKCAAWKETDKRLQTMIDKSKEEFVEKLLGEGGSGRAFYSATRSLASASSTPAWTVSDLFVGMEAGDVCDQVLSFFGAIAGAPAEPIDEFPRVPGGLPEFTRASTAELIKNSKKTDSRVEGDPLAHLMRMFPDEFAMPVSKIYNRINESGCWPAQWKKEHLTVIPKKPNPADLSECRNISCTSAFSKILEGQVLRQLREELEPDPAQYGGIPKCGVEHLLIDLWDKVMEGLDSGTSVAVLLGVDYEKAFNRMEHATCLRQLERLGASRGSISLVRAFLENRQMTITVNGVKARSPVRIQRGSPQGSVLGCLLYCVTTQSITEGIRESVPARDGREEPAVFMYVDDTTVVDVVGVDEAVLHMSAGPTRANYPNLAVGRDFNVIEDRAEAIKMRVNPLKTQLLVIGPRNGQVNEATITSRTGDTVSAIPQLKLVGFTFGTEPNAGAHMQYIRDRFRRRVWMLYHLRKAGFKKRPLYALYCVYIRSIIEYCSVVYHPMLTKGQEEDLERLHRLAIRICYDFDTPIETIMAANGIETLAVRRIRRCDAFIRKARSNPKFADRWFPPRGQVGWDVRNRRRIQEGRFLTSRSYNSPLAFIRRRANDLGIAPGAG